MPATAVPQAGSYDILVDVGFLIDGFVLDDPVKGVLDNTTYVLDGTTSYASVASGTISCSIKRGRQDENDAFNNGTAVFTLNETSRHQPERPIEINPHGIRVRVLLVTLQAESLRLRPPRSDGDFLLGQ